MQALHWVALILAVVGVALVFFGIKQQRDAAPGEEIVGGFGGPAGTSDVGTEEGFGARYPQEHYPVGRLWRLVGMALVLVALVLVVIQSLR